jgi:hypothetical protein
MELEGVINLESPPPSSQSTISTATISSEMMNKSRSTKAFKFSIFGKQIMKQVLDEGKLVQLESGCSTYNVDLLAIQETRFTTT